MDMVEMLAVSLYSAGVERAKARYVVADAIAFVRMYPVQNGADGAQLLRAADVELEELYP
jgi:hypothetical protein